MAGAEDDDVQFMRTEDHLCLSCVPVSGVKRMALSGEVFGNRMCYLEDISNEVCCPDLASCIFVLEQAVSVRALQEMVNTTSPEQSSASQGGQTTFRTLLYGHAVLLRHYHSQMYLSCLSTSTSNDKLAFDVGLKEDAQGESCWWTIHPASKQRSEGEKVRFNDDVILVSVFSERYLHAYMSTSERGRVNASFRQQVWSLVPISSGVARVKNPGFVLGGDVIRLMHGNMDHCITTPPPDSQVPDDAGSLFIKSGAAIHQARSLWRIECFKIKWYSGFVGWSSLVRLRHVTSGLYLAVVGDENGPKVTCISKKNASAIAVTFEMKMSKEKQAEDIQEQENLGVPTVKYGDTIVFIRHVDSDLWISYETLELTIKGIGKVEEKRIIPAVEGHMDDCFRLVRAQEQEQKTALVIRICNAILGRFSRTDPMSIDAEAVNHLLSKSDVVQALLQDLIGFFSQPPSTLDHEEKQLRLKALRNRQDLFQEEGMIRILIAAINFFSERRDKSLLLEGVEEKIEDITNKLYVVLAALIKGNRANCSNFAQTARLNWLVNRLQSQQASGGVLEVLHSVLVDSPEVLNMITESHILAIIGLLDRNGRDPKVLDTLCSLCVNNGVAVRANQNLICENLLQRKDLLLQTALVDHVACMRPNILVGVEDGESMYKKWYFEVVIDHIEQVTHAQPHIRIGWATTHFQPSPGHGDSFASNGIGDNPYSYGFDGRSVWFAGRAYDVANRIISPNEPMQHIGFKKNDVIGCLLDLNIPEMWFSLNGIPVKGLLREFNLSGMFCPAISISSRVSCRFIFGGEHGRFLHRPPDGAAPLFEAMLAKQKVAIEPCFSFGNIERNRLDGPSQFQHRIAFTPQPVKTSHIVFPSHLENVRDRLAENIHELWSMNKIASGWRFGEFRDDSQKVHPCLTTFAMLPLSEKQYHTTTAMENLKSLLALGYHIGVEIKTDDRRLKYVKLPNTYIQPNGYKPQPLDLSSIVLSNKMEELIETLAENTHNVWAAGRIKDGFTYGVSDNPRQKRSPHLIPYAIVDDSIKKINRDTASETVKTLLAYGYTIETPTADVEDLNRRNKEAMNSSATDRISTYRTYRAEQTFAVNRGKWYYEVELLTAGRILIGWGHASKLDAFYPLGTDANGYAFDGTNARRFHHNISDGFGKVWQKNDIVGCMIDLHDKTISFSLNGELMLDNFGNETAFDGLDVDEIGFVPVLTSFSGQKARLNFGQDVNSLRYFTSCGLQEGYEPFCVNMSRSLTFWYSNFIPRFQMIKSDSTSMEVTRVGASRDNPPLIKLQSRLFGTLEKVEFEFLRLSLPLTCHDQFTPRQMTLDRRQMALHEFMESQEEKRTFAFPPTSMTGLRIKQTGPGTSDTLDSNLSNPNDANPNFLSPDAIPSKSTRNPTNLLVKFRDQTTSKKSPSPSPPASPMSNGNGHLNGISPDTSIDRLNKANAKAPTSKLNNFFQRFSKEPNPNGDVQSKANKRTIKLSGNSTTSTNASQQIQPQSVLKVPTLNSSPASIGATNAAKQRASNTPAGGRRSFLESDTEMTDQQGNDFEHDEIRAINEHVHEYYYAVRILPGQNPRSVYIGWVTSRFKPIVPTDLFEDANFTPSQRLAKLIRRCTITQTDNDGSILESFSRQDAYMFCAADLLENIADSENVARRVVNGLVIGCLCDVSTGILSFYVNGKESAQKLEVEPSTKLYPSVFVEPTVKEFLQFELGRIRNCLPLTAALFPSLNREERFLPQLPSRLNLQSLLHCHWSRVPNANIRCQQLKLSEVRGWSVFVEDPVQMEAVYIPEDDRCTDILGLVEDEDNLSFCSNTLMLYNAICAQGNNRVAHEICKLVDEKQLMYCVKNLYLCGAIRIGIHNLLIAMHFETHMKARSLTSTEFVIPLSSLLRKNLLFRSVEHQRIATTTYIPAMEQFLAVRPKLIKEEDFKVERERKLLVPPPFNVSSLKEYVMNSLIDAIEKSSRHLRDPVGGTYANWLVPLLQLVDSLLVMGALEVNDIQHLLRLIDPTTFNWEIDTHFDEGLLQMKLDEPVKLQMCLILQHLCDYQLQYRIEGMIAFSEDFVGRLQSDQKRRYNVLKESSLPPALMAKKTREFRCPPKDQMQALMDFKRDTMDAMVGNEDMQEEIKEMLKNFHSNLLILQQVVEADGNEGGELNLAKVNELDRQEQVSLFQRLLEIVIRHALKKKIEDKTMQNLQEKFMLKSGKTLSEVIKETVIRWGRLTHIADPNLIREMFKLIYNQYDGIGEVSRCLERTYIINEKSVPDITLLLRKLSIVRALLTVQMDADEEAIMISCLSDIMDNRVFYQHPDLMRSLCVHETVMAIMVNRLNKSKQEQTSMSAMNDVDGLAQSTEIGENQEIHPVKDDKVELVTTCCKFLSYFCRTSRHNQRAMFEHLSYLLENSSMLLSRPSLRGSAPLDVACASVMDNNELALALRESHLEKIASYLSRCGTTRNEELFLQGYHDIGWDPVDGERFLDFLKFCVWVNGDTVEENADLVVRLLIRRPDCLGPALRGEGGGLLKAIREGIAQSLYIARRQNADDPVIQAAYQEIIDDETMHNLNEEYDRLQVRLPYEDDEEYIDLGAAELSFYAILVELLGRCAPSEETIKMGKPNATRAKSILKSLVSMHDLEGVLGLKFLLPHENTMPPGLQPSHKMSIILFLERVYGIPDQETFFRLIEDAFLPDIRAATILDMAAIADSDMALALNRYLCTSVMPMMTSHAHYFDDCDHRSSLLESILHTVYRLSKCRSLTKNQLDTICDFLLAFANQLKPSMMTPLLRKLVHDVPALTDQTIVPLRMLTQWYERCSRYYSVAATEEEKRLTMMLFQKIFDALASRAYDPELFGKALPCLTAIGSALSPDYSYSFNQQDNLDHEREKIEMSRIYEPSPADTTTVVLTPEFEELVKSYAESVHDQWSYAKIEQGWVYGEQINDKYRQHPNLRPYKLLDRKDASKLEDPIREALKSIEKLQFRLEKTETGARVATKPLQRKKQKDKTAPDYLPKAMDFTSVTMNREMQDLSEALAKNAHEFWAKQMKNRLAAIGGGLHSRLVPYDLLTEKEQQKDLKFYQDFVKFLNVCGYRVNKKVKEDEMTSGLNNLVTSSSSLSTSNITQTNEKRFAYSLLEKLLEYVERASSTMQNYKESSKFSLHESYRLTTKDVKFFGKVVLPLVEKYFQAHRDYFITPSSLKTGTGYATVKEKEMSCSLFCKLAFLLRQKFSAFGNEVNISVRCLKVLVRAIDVSSVMKNSQEMVRASLLPLFNNIAEDLNQTVQNLEQRRYSHIKGTLQRGTTSLAYVHMVLLPVLSSMLDHLGKNNYGVDVFENEIQLAGYKILNALWIIGTQGTKFVDREWIIDELNRHRPLLGDCLSSFASCFPIAFFEPEFNGNNKNASNVSQLSPEANDVMTNVARTIPHLTKVISDIEEHAEARVKYEDVPYVVEVILPCICSYLPYWWSVSAQRAKLSNEPKVTNVTAEYMNSILGSVLKLINNNIDAAEAPWMKRIAVYTQAIILNSSTTLIEPYFLPVSQRLKEKCEDLYGQEQSLKHATRLESSEREDLESNLMKNYEILVRDLYAFGPLLIKYVDMHRSYWLKNGDLHADLLYNNMAEVFSTWCKSKYFKREELNFVTQHEIDNTSMLMPSGTNTNAATAVSSTDTSTMKSPADSVSPGSSGGKQKRKKRRLDKEKFTSLSVACIKRMLPVGMNTFGGREQELVQLAKHKMIEMKIAHDEKVEVPAEEQMILDLTGDQEESVEEFLRDIFLAQEQGEVVNKNNWQSALYRKIGSKSHQTGVVLSQEASIKNMLKMAKVLFGLNLVDHPPTHRRGTWRKLVSSQRKKAIMACFRMAPLHSVPRHRAMNMFLRAYRELWLEAEEDTRARLIEHLCDDFQETADQEVTTIKEETETENESLTVTLTLKPDPLRQLLQCLNRAATTAQVFSITEDVVFLSYSTIMSKSCVIEEDDDDGGAEEVKSFQEQEMEKQKLLYEQNRLANRGAAETVLLYISASKGENNEMLRRTLELGISLLHGGNRAVQKRMLDYLKETKDVGCFTSLATLMANCSVLDLDTFERCIKAEVLGVGADGMAGEKNLHDADFTISLFRFCQLLCEGHNLEFQNYLRLQAGSNTNVNIIICTVDYLLSLQESIMDFYWHYSGKETVDAHGKENFCRAINVAKQVFNTLTEYIQGPCPQNQLALANSRLWDAISGFLYIFAHMQRKLSQDPMQIELLRELMKLQKDMIIMLLSMLEGNVLNGPIGKQMVDTLIESQSNVELLLQFFDIFLKMKGLTTSEAFQEFDTNKDGFISPKEFRRAMENQKMYSSQDIDYILMCVDTNQDGKIDFMEFTERFHNPAKDIGFNMAVLLTNLSEHMPHDTRLQRLMDKAKSFLSYFQDYLGRIEIKGGGGYIERVYFEIKETNIEQWNKPHIKESKKAFLHLVVNETDDKEKLEQFINFCEDTIFEMQHAVALSGEEEEQANPAATAETTETVPGHPTTAEPVKLALSYSWSGVKGLFHLLRPSTIRNGYQQFRQMTFKDMIKSIFGLFVGFLRLLMILMIYTFRTITYCIWNLMAGEDQNETKSERVALPPPTKRRDHHLPSVSIAQLGFTSAEDSPPVAAFGLGLNAEHEPHHKMSLTDEQINLIDFNDSQTFDNDQKPLFSNHLDSNGATSVTTTAHIVPSTQHLQHQHSVTASVPHQPQLTTTMQISPELIEKSKSSLEINVQAEYKIKTPTININGNLVEDDDFIPPEPPARTDYGKKALALVARNYHQLKFMALCLAFVINFLMLFYRAMAVPDAAAEEVPDDAIESVDDDDANEVIMMDPKNYYMVYLLKTSAFLHSCIAFLMMISYYKLKVPLVIFKREKEIARKLEFEGSWLIDQPSENNSWILSYLSREWHKLVISSKSFPDCYWDKFVKKKVRNKYSDQFDYDELSRFLGMEKNDTPGKFEIVKPVETGLWGKIKSVDMRYQVWKWGVIFTDNSFLYVFFYFLFSVIGNFSFFVFAIHLLDVAISVKALSTILKSITHNGRQLVLTIMLMAVVVYLYTVIAFNFFRKFYTKEEDEEKEENCKDMFTCFKFHLYSGIRAGGGIGDELESPNGDPLELYRIVFDITFFFFIIVILLAIIQGLIIDAFGDLREQLDSVKETLESKCFICGIGQDYFDKEPHGFETHTTAEHNFANYMFFLTHLLNKPDTEYTGQESYVWEMYQSRKWDFFPVGDCFRRQYEPGGGGATSGDN